MPLKYLPMRTYYTVEQGAADIIYTRTHEGGKGEAFILKNTKEAVKHVSQLLVDFRSDKVTRQPY